MSALFRVTLFLNKVDVVLHRCEQDPDYRTIRALQIKCNTTPSMDLRNFRVGICSTQDTSLRAWKSVTCYWGPHVLTRSSIHVKFCSLAIFLNFNVNEQISLNKSACILNFLTERFHVDCKTNDLNCRSANGTLLLSRSLLSGMVNLIWLCSFHTTATVKHRTTVARQVSQQASTE